MILLLRLLWHWLWHEPAPDPDCPWWPGCKCRTLYQCLEWSAW